MSHKMRTSKTEARTREQRERILAAAQTCFMNSGFHAASMATIAETANMSPGLIYRYFDSKNAIILAIIDHQLEAARCRIRQLHASKDLAAGIVDHFYECDAHDVNLMSAALFLEMSAEVARDPQIAAALSNFDATVRSEITDWLCRSKAKGGHGLPADIAPARALILVCLIDGVKVRSAREPTLDKNLLSLALNEIVSALLVPAGGDCRRAGKGDS